MGTISEGNLNVAKVGLMAALLYLYPLAFLSL
jgi:hypothetical protein